MKNRQRTQLEQEPTLDPFSLPTNIQPRQWLLGAAQDGASTEGAWAEEAAVEDDGIPGDAEEALQLSYAPGAEPSHDARPRRSLRLWARKARLQLKRKRARIRKARLRLEQEERKLAEAERALKRAWRPRWWQARFWG